MCVNTEFGSIVKFIKLKSHKIFILQDRREKSSIQMRNVAPVVQHFTEGNVKGIGQPKSLFFMFAFFQENVECKAFYKRLEAFKARMTLVEV